MEPRTKWATVHATIVYLCWKIDVIVADHDGHCSDAENDEILTQNSLWCSYAVGDAEAQQLKQLQNEDPNFFEMFNASNVLTDLLPPLENDGVGVTGGRSYF